MFCNECGEGIGGLWHFCASCGANVTGENKPLQKANTDASVRSLVGRPKQETSTVKRSPSRPVMSFADYMKSHTDSARQAKFKPKSKKENVTAMKCFHRIMNPMKKLFLMSLTLRVRNQRSSWIRGANHS